MRDRDLDDEPPKPASLAVCRRGAAAVALALALLAPAPAISEEEAVEDEETAPPAEETTPDAQREGIPLGFAGRPRKLPSETDADFLPIPDRWRIGFPRWERYPGQPGEYPYTEGRWWDPYNQNLLKGDYPVLGEDVFFVFTGVSDTVFEARRIPIPSGIPAAEPDSDGFFGQTEQLFVNQNWIFAFELFEGDSLYKPRDWEVRFTPVFNVSYADVGEENVLEIDPREGTTRTDGHIGVQEALVEYHLGDLTPYYDFWSVRAGVQGFTSDFRGFIFSDNQLGARLFGNYGANRHQWNLAYFRPLEKDTNSGLNILDSRDPFGDDGRQQDIAVANYYRQDTIWPGYTTSLSFHYNGDHADRVHFDDNAFLVRPAAVGSVIPTFEIRFHDVDAYYIGWTGEGHIERLNVSHAFYQAFGEDEFNPISARETDVFAQLVALELSIDRDWLRSKFSFLWASGDGDPLDDTATGFDTILDNTAFAGGGFSYWNRQGLPLTGAPVFLNGRLSPFPSLRSSKIEGQPNFVNPGLFLYNVGFDAELAPKWKAIVNVSYLQFAKTDSLELILEQAKINKAIGIDYSLGVQYRPLLIDNVIVAAGAAALSPLEGFREILISETQYSTFVALTLTY
ncbi:MAG: hypothetical protein ACREQY_23615, partial [Candidatus Binatia bacterium]